MGAHSIHAVTPCSKAIRHTRDDVGACVYLTHFDVLCGILTFFWEYKWNIWIPKFSGIQMKHLNSRIFGNSKEACFMKPIAYKHWSIAYKQWFTDCKQWCRTQQTTCKKSIQGWNTLQEWQPHSVRLHQCIHVCLSAYFECLLVYLFFLLECLPVCMSACLHVSLFACLNVCLPVCMFACLYQGLEFIFWMSIEACPFEFPDFREFKCCLFAWDPICMPIHMHMCIIFICPFEFPDFREFKCFI